MPPLLGCSLSQGTSRAPTCVFIGLSWNYTICWFSLNSDGMQLWERCVLGPRTTVGLDGVWDYTCIRWLRMPPSCSLVGFGWELLESSPSIGSLVGFELPFVHGGPISLWKRDPNRLQPAFGGLLSVVGRNAQCFGEPCRCMSCCILASCGGSRARFRATDHLEGL